MADDLNLPTSVPYDDAGLLDLAQRIRTVAARGELDPDSMYFDPALRASSEANVQAALLRAGVRDPGPATPEQLAEQATRESFRFTEMPAGLVDTINERAAAVQSRENVAAEAKSLRDQLGAAEYDALLTDAKAAMPTLPAGVTADLQSLRILAAQGKYLRAFRAGSR